MLIFVSIWADFRPTTLFLAIEKAPKIDPGTLCFRPVSRKIDPKTRPRALLGASGGRKKNLGRAWNRPKTISQPFFAVLKTDPLPPPGMGGGHAVQRTLVLERFFWFKKKIAVFVRDGCKNRGSRV